MSKSSAEIYVITGPCGVGKSTISRMIAQNIKKSAFIEGDILYHMIIGGYVKPWEDDGTYMELFWENVLALTENFIKRGISVSFEYVVFPEHIVKFLKKFSERNIPVNYVVLLADEDTIRERDSMREVDCRMGERAITLLKQFKGLNIEEKFILDTTNLSKEQVVRTIMADDRFLLKPLE